MNNVQSERQQFSNEEISFLQMRRNGSVLLIIGCISAFGFGYFFYADDIADFGFYSAYLTIIAVIFGSLIFREAKKLSRLNSDLRGNFKVCFEAEIEDLQHADEIRETGANLSSKCFIIVGGRKYRVKADDYLKFGRGDLVGLTVAPASKYAFKVEKISAAKKSVSGDTLFGFTSPLY